MVRIKLSKDWKWDSELDRYENQNTDFIITGQVVRDSFDKSRPVYNHEIVDILDKLYKENYKK